MPCCYDGLTARLIEQHGFPITFMTGFGVSTARGHPDTQLLSYGEMVDNARQVRKRVYRRMHKGCLSSLYASRCDE